MAGCPSNPVLDPEEATMLSSALYHNHYEDVELKDMFYRSPNC